MAWKVESSSLLAHLLRALETKGEPVKKTTTLTLALGLLCLARVGWAADPNPPSKPAAEATATPKLPPRATIDWEKMSESQKKKYMKATVLPEMKKLFMGFDKKYKNMTCATCHGSKAAENKFKMPTAELPKLPQPTDRAGFMALHDKKPEVVKFMGTEVKPAMAALLNLDEWNPTNPKGFGCYGCHTAGGAAPAPAAATPAPASPPAAGKPPEGKPAAGKPAEGW
jgi:mono/diheme cytochrome c family protein